MKINYVLWNLKCTGGNRVIFEIANGLVDRGYDVTITAAGGDPNWFPLRAKLRIFRSYFKYPSLLNMMSSFFTMMTKKHEADVVIATWAFTAYPVKYSGNGKKFYHIQHYEPLFFNQPFKYLVKRTYSFPLKLISNCIWLRNMLKKKHNRDSVIINPGIDLKLFRPKKLKKDSSKKRIVCLGKDYIPWKGVQDAFKAMEIVNEKRKDVELIFYGIRPLTTKNPKVPYRFIKFPSDEELVNLYNLADLVLCPSWYESFPLPPLEAMACGVPIVTTRYGTEDYAFDGKNSLVIPPKRPKLMAEAILKVLDDEKLARRLRENGIKTAKKFTWKNTVDKFERLLKEI